MKILRPRQAAEKCGIGLPTIWAWARDKPDFPKPIQLSGNASGFIEAELDDWLERKVTEFRAAPVKRETAVAAAQKSAAARQQRKTREANHAAA